MHLERGNNGVEILLVLVERYVLEGRASIGKASVVCAEEYGHCKRRTTFTTASFRRRRERENFLQNE